MFVHAVNHFIPPFPPALRLSVFRLDASPPNSVRPHPRQYPLPVYSPTTTINHSPDISPLLSGSALHPPVSCPVFISVIFPILWLTQLARYFTAFKAGASLGEILERFSSATIHSQCVISNVASPLRPPTYNLFRT